MIRWNSNHAKELIDKKYPRDLIYLSRGVMTKKPDFIGDDSSCVVIPFWLMFSCAIVDGSVSITPMYNDIVEQDTIRLGVKKEQVYWKHNEDAEGLKDKLRNYMVLEWQHKWNKSLWRETYTIKFKVYSDGVGGIDPVERELVWDVESHSGKSHDRSDFPST